MSSIQRSRKLHILHLDLCSFSFFPLNVNLTDYLFWLTFFFVEIFKYFVNVGPLASFKNEPSKIIKK